MIGIDELRRAKDENSGICGVNIGENHYGYFRTDESTDPITACHVVYLDRHLGVNATYDKERHRHDAIALEDVAPGQCGWFITTVGIFPGFKAVLDFKDGEAK